jgi:hypothetical protein
MSVSATRMMFEDAGSARQTGKGADCRPLFIPPQPGAARNPGQNGTPQAPPNSLLANGSELKQIGVLKPGAHHFARLAPTGPGDRLAFQRLTRLSARIQCCPVAFERGPAFTAGSC